MKIHFTFFTIILALFGRNNLTAQTVVDIDGNVYNTVTIGTQEWMSENLKTTKFSNGDALLNPSGSSFWITYSPAWIYYNSNAANDSIYGKLYNGYAAKDNRNLCPVGWRVPTVSDWQTLINKLGYDSAGIIIKDDLIWNGTNESGFYGLPAGIHYSNAGFMLLGTHGYWWTSTPKGNYNVNFAMAQTSSDTILLTDQPGMLGMSVRCINDTSIILGVSKQENITEQFSFYPNPSKEYILINSSFIGSVVAEIFDTQGKRIINYTISLEKDNPFKINLPKLLSGLYFIRITNEKGGIHQQKILIE